MDRNQSVDLEALTALIKQLSELNSLLSEEQKNSLRESPRLYRPFLFGFDFNSSATGDEYARYVAYMEIINRILSEFGIRIGNNGYAYITDAVKIIIDRKTYDLRLKSDIFPLLSAKYHVRSFSAIEHSIRNSINSAYSDYLRNPAANKMGIFGKRPTCKKFLVFIASTVQQSMCENLMKSAG